MIIHASYSLDKGELPAMLEKTSLILTVPPASLRQVRRFHLPVAHMAYRIGGGPHLFRASIPVSIRGGLMVIDNAGFSGGGEPGPFCQEVLRECAARGFTGALCDFEGPAVQPLPAIVQTLGEAFQRRGWPLYVTEGYGDCSGRARVLISSAVSGGSLRQRLQEAVERYGASRTVLAAERVAEDFYLPSPTGQGIPLTREELHRRLEERSPQVYFSSELCAHYFTYMSDRSGAHFVLFDDAPSIRKKLQLARQMEIGEAVLAYPQVDDVLEEILAV